MRKKKTLALMALLLLAAAAAIAVIGRQSEFTGSRIKNSDAYLLDIQRMSGTDSHTLTLKKGDTLAVTFETTGGRLTMEIAAPDGEILYQGNGSEISEFTLAVPEDGTYAISVRAERAKGTIHVRLANRTRAD